MTDAKVIVAREALVLLRGRRIDAFGGSSLEGQLAEDTYETIVRGLFTAYPWSFATEEALMNRLADDADDSNPMSERWDAAYQIPTDPKPLSIDTVLVGSGGSSCPWPFARYRDTVLTNAGEEDDVTLVYRYYSDIDDWPAYFRLHVVTSLAGLWAIPVTTKKQLRDEARENAITFFNRAKFADARAGHAKKVTRGRLIRTRRV